MNIDFTADEISLLKELMASTTIGPQGSPQGVMTTMRLMVSIADKLDAAEEQA